MLNERRVAVVSLVRDLQVAVHVDDVLKTELAAEAIGAAERLGGEPGQVVDVGGNALGEQSLQHRIGESLVVEQLLEAVQSLVAAGVLKERLCDSHTSIGFLGPNARSFRRRASAR